MDMEDPSSLDALFDEVPDLDAVVCCAASGPLVDLESAADEEIVTGVQAKLLGQVALVQRAVRRLRDGGSITLTGGTFSTPLAAWFTGGSRQHRPGRLRPQRGQRAAAKASHQSHQPWVDQGNPGKHGRRRERGNSCLRGGPGVCDNGGRHRARPDHTSVTVRRGWPVAIKGDGPAT